MYSPLYTHIAFVFNLGVCCLLVFLFTLWTVLAGVRLDFLPASVSVCPIMAPKCIQCLVDKLIIGIIFHLRGSDVYVVAIEFPRCEFS